MNITITNSNGKWLINDKPFSECNEEEKSFFIEFLKAFKYED